MIVPRRAPVRPRVLSALSGESLLLEEIIADLVQSQSMAAIQISGPAGSGKTTALEHLAEVLAGANIQFLDNPDKAQLLAPSKHAWIVYAVPFPYKDFPATAAFTLAPWSMDEVLEYLLTVHRDRCASIMTRLRSDPDVDLLEGNAELWRITLEQLAAKESIPNVHDALQNYLTEFIPSMESRLVFGQLCVVKLLGGTFGQKDLARIKEQDGMVILGQVFRHRSLQLLLAVNQMMVDIQKNAPCKCFAYRFPRDLLKQAVLAARDLPLVLDNLKTWFKTWPERHAMAASILLGAAPVGSVGSPNPAASRTWPGPTWAASLGRISTCPGVTLSEADLNHANLERASLEGALAEEANFRHANLQRASLNKIMATKADLAYAKLHGVKAQSAFFDQANLEFADLQKADLSKAAFTGANLTGARFAAADLRQARLVGAQMENADFSGANLEGADLEEVVLREGCFLQARFANAKLHGCDLEGMELPTADFKGANLQNALLTDSVMPDAIFDGACLIGAGLAEINWERASLRNADLHGVSFHLGSSRNGLVGSPIACE